jgi:8-oxo-dGTP pyrophosphatase MutT (NUDIX family)
MSAAAELSIDALVKRIADQNFAFVRSRLMQKPPAAPVVPTRGDYDFNPEFKPPPGPRKLTPAAVLLPIVSRDVPTVLFTRRTATLTKHAGQVSFPGGRVEADDLSPLETALRETQEEVGITSDFVSVAGFMEGYETGTGFAILPVVGILHEGFALVPEPSEVAEIFEVPLAFLLDPKNCERQSAEWQGHKREFYAFNYGSHYIWGATAAILVAFAQKLTAP